jgi:hypothetical protein
MLNILKVVSDPNRTWANFDIPSEEGFGLLERVSVDTPHSVSTKNVIHSHSRIVLTAKNYTGLLIVGADDVDPVERKFELTWNAETQQARFVLTGG